MRTLIISSLTGLFCLCSGFASAHKVHSHHALPSENLPHSSEVEKLVQPTHSSENQISDGFDELVKNYQRSGDDRYLAQARARLPKSDANLNVQQLLQAAWLAQAEHRFSDAQTLLLRLLQLEPDNTHGWLMKSAIHLVSGEADAARSACQKIDGRHGLLLLLTCQAQVAQTASEQHQALQKLQAILRLGLPAPEAVQAWAHSVAGDLARSLRRFDDADQHYQDSLAVAASVQVRSAYADSLLAQGKFATVSALIDDSETAPALAVRKLIARQGSGENIDAATARMDETFQLWIARRDFRHAREMAMFYLQLQSDPQLALVLARENMKTQREPEDVGLLARAEGITE